MDRVRPMTRRTLTNVPTLTRRQVFRVGGVAVSGFFLEPMMRPVNVWAKEKVKPRGSAEFCIFLNLAGGASHVDTFDIKEGRWLPPNLDVRTLQPGLRMPVGLFPMLSARMRQLALVRSMQAWENEHIRAQYYLQVAHAPSPSRLKEMPSLGSVVAYELESQRRPGDYLPPFVAMNFTSGAFRVIGEGCLDSRHTPLTLETEAGFDFVVPKNETARFERRWDILGKFEKLGGGVRSAEDFQAYYRGAHAMMQSPDIRKTLSLDEGEQKRYGGTKLGDACLLARNLVQARAGTRFVMISHHGWDHHGKIYDPAGGLWKLARELDAAFANLLNDLEESKLLEKTLVCCLGEFGRTPGELTVNQGRDHHKDAFSGLFAGAGVQGGRVLGVTDELGAKIKDPGWHKKRPVYFEDVAATIYSALGIDWTKTIASTPSGRAFEYVEPQSGTDFFSPGEISELFG